MDRSDRSDHGVSEAGLIYSAPAEDGHCKTRKSQTWIMPKESWDEDV